MTAMDLQRIDMGIAMAHFDLTAHASNLRGGWQVLEPPLTQKQSPRVPESWQKAAYLVSWCPE
jgi:hypothetical protein